MLVRSKRREAAAAANLNNGDQLEALTDELAWPSFGSRYLLLDVGFE